MKSKKKPRVTLKRKRLLKHVLKADNLKEASIKAGYSNTTKSIYSKATSDYLADNLGLGVITREKLQKEFEKVIELARKKRDYSNVLRALENITRMFGMFLDKSEVKTEITQPEAFKNALERNQGLIPPSEN